MVFFDPCFSVFGLSELGKIRSRKNFAFGHFSRSDLFTVNLVEVTWSHNCIIQTFCAHICALFDRSSSSLNLPRKAVLKILWTNLRKISVRKPNLYKVVGYSL